MPRAFVLQPFGPVDIDDDDYWEAVVSYAGRDLRLDLNTDTGAVTEDAIAQAGLLLSNVESLDMRGREAIREEHRKTEGDARLFHSHHRDCLGEHAWLRLVGEPKPSRDDWGTFFSQCRLKRIGIYIEDPQQFIVSDYTLGEGVTDYVLSVSFDTDGLAQSVAMES